MKNKDVKEWIHIKSKDGHIIAVPANDVQYHRACQFVHWNGFHYASQKVAWELCQLPNAFVIKSVQ